MRISDRRRFLTLKAPTIGSATWSVVIGPNWVTIKQQTANATLGIHYNVSEMAYKHTQNATFKWQDEEYEQQVQKGSNDAKNFVKYFHSDLIHSPQNVEVKIEAIVVTKLFLLE